VANEQLAAKMMQTKNGSTGNFNFASGVHWKPSDLLMELAEQGKSFAQWEKERS